MTVRARPFSLLSLSPSLYLSLSHSWRVVSGLIQSSKGSESSLLCMSLQIRGYEKKLLLKRHRRWLKKRPSPFFSIYYLTTNRNYLHENLSTTNVQRTSLMVPLSGFMFGTRHYIVRFYYVQR